MRAKHYWIDIQTNSTRCRYNTLLESSPQKTRSPIFPCPCSRASSSQVQLHPDNRFLGNSNSPLIRTKSDSLGFTSYIYFIYIYFIYLLHIFTLIQFRKLEPLITAMFCCPFLCISPMIPVTASDFILFFVPNSIPKCLARIYIFRQVCGALLARGGSMTWHIR